MTALSARTLAVLVAASTNAQTVTAPLAFGASLQTAPVAVGLMGPLPATGTLGGGTSSGLLLL